MECTKKKKYWILLFLLLAFFILYKKESINQIFSEICIREEGHAYSNFDSDVNALGEILSGDVLCQPLCLQRGAVKVGVRFGTYIRTNNADYVLTVYDQDRNVIGKVEISASTIRDNQMCYVPIYARTDAGQNYQLEIRSENAAPGNSITCYGTDIEEGHQGISWNGEDTDFELATEIIYQKVVPISEYTIVFLAVFLLLYLFWPEIKIGYRACMEFIREILKKYKKRLIVGSIAFCLIWVLLLLLFPATEYKVLRNSSRDEENAIPQAYTGKLSQTFIASEEFDAIEIKFGTYMASYVQGEITLAVYDAGSRMLLSEKRIPAKYIEDNQFLRIEMGKLLPENTYCMELQAEGFSGQPLALYFIEDGEGFIFRLLKGEKAYSAITIFGLLLFMAVMAIWYFCLFARIKMNYKKIFVVTLLSVAVGILLNTYANYRKISLAVLAKNLGLLGQTETLTLDREQIKEGTTRDIRYGHDGEIYCINELIYLNNLHMRIENVTCYFFDEGENLPIINHVTLHADTGTGYPIKPESSYEYTYRGQKSVSIPIGETKRIESLVLGCSRYARYSGDLVSADSKWFEMDKIVINGFALRFKIFSWSFLLGFFLVWGIYGWQHFKIEEHIEKVENSGNIEMKLFAFLALISGLIMSFLVPAYQIPDEPYHIQHVFESIGANSAWGEMNGFLIQATDGVKDNPGIRINTELYYEKLNSHLSEYPNSFSVNMEILKYPGSALGTFLGLLMHLPIGTILFFGEFFALLVYIFLGALAIRITPIRKKLFLILLLLPVPVHQAASYSYDSFNNALSLLLIACCLNLILRKKKVELGDLIKLIVMSFLLLYIKTIYVLLVLLALLIPYRKIPGMLKIVKFLNNKKRKIIVFLCSIFLLVLGGLIAFRILPGMLGVGEGRINNIQQALKYPKELIVLLGRTVFGGIKLWAGRFSIGFGWLDIQMESWVTGVVFIELFFAALLQGEKDEAGWGRKHYFICLAVFVAISILIIFSMFGWAQYLWPISGGVQNWLLLFDTIDGIQGRYFIPIIILPFLFPVSKKETALKKLPLRLCLLVAWIVVAVYTVGNLLNRYWI